MSNMNRIEQVFKWFTDNQEFDHFKEAIVKVFEGDEKLDSFDKLKQYAKDNQIEVKLENSLSERVGGWARIIDGEKVIFLNENKSKVSQDFTFREEIGHHVLEHLTKKEHIARPLVLKEFEAKTFAAFSFLHHKPDSLSNTRYWQKYSTENPLIIIPLFIAFVGATGVLIGSIWNFAEWLLEKQIKYKKSC